MEKSGITKKKSESSMGYGRLIQSPDTNTVLIFGPTSIMAILLCQLDFLRKF